MTHADSPMHPSSSRHPPAGPRLRLWGWPIAMGLLSGTGLGTALVSDTWGDWWSWIGLGVPMAVIAWFALRRTPGSPTKRKQR